MDTSSRGRECLKFSKRASAIEINRKGAGDSRAGVGINERKIPSFCQLSFRASALTFPTSSERAELGVRVTLDKLLSLSGFRILQSED